LNSCYATSSCGTGHQYGTLRLRRNRLALGIMLEVSRDAAAAGDEKLVSCAAEQSKYCFICTVAI
jgi:hypothetical protein